MKSTSSLILHHILWRGLYFFSVLLLNIGIARFFAAEQSGQLFFIVNNLAFILLVVSASLESGAVYYINSENINSSQVARLCMIWAGLASVVAVAFWYVMLDKTGSAFLKDPWFIFYCFLFILGVLLTTYFTALFYAKREFGLPNRILFTVNAVLIFILFAGKNNNFVKFNFTELYFIGFFVQGIFILLFYFKKNIPAKDKFLPPPKVLSKIISYSLSALLANGIYFLVNRVDYWFVKYYCSGNDLGNYIQASKLGQMLFILPAILGATLFPIFSSQEKTDNAGQLSMVIRILLGINFFICLMILSSGHIIFPMIFGPTFNKMYLLFAWLVPGILAVTVNYPVTAWFSAENRMGVNIRGALLGLLVICAGDFIVLPRYGIQGAPIVSSAGYLTYSLYSIGILRKYHRIPWKDFIILRKSDILRLQQSILAKINQPPAGSQAPKNLNL